MFWQKRCVNAPPKRHPSLHKRAQDEQFKSYHMVLIGEKLIDFEEGKFHKDFIGQFQISEGAKNCVRFSQT